MPAILVECAFISNKRSAENDESGISDLYCRENSRRSSQLSERAGWSGVKRICTRARISILGGANLSRILHLAQAKC